MIQRVKNYFIEPKSKIGFGHGIVTIIGAIILGYLTMMLYSKFMVGDAGVKIIPSMILTPLFMACYSIWLLFSKTIIQSIQKLLILSIVIVVILKVF